MTVLADRLARAITLAGPIPLSQFMAAANAHYYATRDPLGAAGDFVTAPEISQMLGELVGLWGADVWDRAGREAPCEGIRQELSAGDARRRPTRRARGHLRGCSACRSWSRRCR